MTIFTEQKNLSAVLQNLQTQPFIEVQRTYLLGISLGGLVLAMTAAEHLHKVRNMVLVYSAFNAPDDARKRPIDETDHYNKAMLDYNPFEHISAYSGNVTIIHGTEDRLVPIAYSERAETVYPNALLIRIEGVGHGFKGEALQQAIQITAAQLDEWESTQN